MKNTVNIYRVFSLLFSIMVLSSCESVLDDVKPVSQISDDVFWQTNNDAEVGLAAAYDAMQKTYRLKKMYWGEFRGDNYVVSELPQPITQDLIENNLSAESSPNYLRWNEFYQMIFRVNLAIEKIPQIQSYNPQLLGEAYALRAMAYFDAYRVWGGVPIFQTGVLSFSDDSFKERATAQEVLDLVLSDLAKAEENISTANDKHIFTKTSVAALKAQVYMHLKRYEDALTEIAVVEAGPFSLASSQKEWRDLFINDEVNYPGEGQDGPEIIMSIRYDLVEDGNNASGIFSTYFQGLPNYWGSPNLINKWIERYPIDSTEWVTKYPGVLPHATDDLSENGDLFYGDYRLYECFTQLGDDERALVVSKYAKSRNAAAIDDTNIILFRLAEILYLKAEALNKTGRQAEALDILNDIRVARGLPEVNSGTVPDIANPTDEDALEDFILDERQFELLAEGYRWWDLVRTDKAVEVMGPINGQTEETIPFPIYFDHLIDNPKLEQTEAYK